MGGGGFMKHADDQNKAYQRQKAHRREVYSMRDRKEGEFPRLDEAVYTFSDLSAEEVASERERIANEHRKQRVKNVLMYSAVLLLFLVAFLVFFVLNK